MLSHKHHKPKQNINVLCRNSTWRFWYTCSFDENNNNNNNNKHQPKTFVCIGCDSFFSDSSPPISLTSLSVPSRRFVQLQTRRYFVSAMLKIVFGHHSFSYCAPKQWNFLPCDNHHIQSSHAFKTTSKNKTKHLYTTGDFKFSFAPSSLPFPLHSFCARARACVWFARNRILCLNLRSYVKYTLVVDLVNKSPFNHPCQYRTEK